MKCDQNERVRPVEKRGSKMQGQVAIVGSPNVGKSALFGQLSKSYATVSNYPGTTVDVAKAVFDYAGGEYELIDTPGMYSFFPMTEDEKVTRRILTDDRPDAVIHVIDAQKVEEMLPLTLQLMEAGLPVVLVLNILDEAEKASVSIDMEGLSQALGVPVVGTACTTGQGVSELRETIARTVAGKHKAPDYGIAYGELTEKALRELHPIIEENSAGLPISTRSAALLYSAMMRIWKSWLTAV